MGFSELESCLITRVKSGMKCGRLPDCGFEEPELAVIRGLKPVNRDSEHSRDKAVLVFVPDRDQVTVRGIDELQDIRTSGQNSAFHFDRLIDCDVGFLVPFISLHGGGEHTHHTQSEDGDSRKRPRITGASQGPIRGDRALNSLGLDGCPLVGQ